MCFRFWLSVSRLPTRCSIFEGGRETPFRQAKCAAMGSRVRRLSAMNKAVQLCRRCFPVVLSPEHCSAGGHAQTARGVTRIVRDVFAWRYEDRSAEEGTRERLGDWNILTVLHAAVQPAWCRSGARVAWCQAL